MTEYAAESSIGARVQAARKVRGIRSTRQLAESLSGTGLTESVLMNIEAGRKNDLRVSDLLNLAHALRVPPVMLLAPLANQTASMDLANLVPDLTQMSVAEFDAWFSGAHSGAYRTTNADERGDRAELEAFRDLQRTRRDLERERAIAEVDRPVASRLEHLEQQAAELIDFLRSSGWVV